MRRVRGGQITLKRGSRELRRERAERREVQSYDAEGLVQKSHWWETLFLPLLVLTLRGAALVNNNTVLSILVPRKYHLRGNKYISNSR